MSCMLKMEASFRKHNWIVSIYCLIFCVCVNVSALKYINVYLCNHEIFLKNYFRDCDTGSVSAKTLPFLPHLSNPICCCSEFARSFGMFSLDFKMNSWLVLTVFGKKMED